MSEEQRRSGLTRRHLPIFLSPTFLIFLIAITVLGQFLWRFISIRWGLDQRPGVYAYVLGVLLGYIEGRWTSLLWDRHYLDSIAGRVRLMDTFLGKLTTIFAAFALGLPILTTLLPVKNRVLISGIQSYVFGFIGGMNLALYLWVRRLPK